MFRRAIALVWLAAGPVIAGAASAVEWHRWTDGDLVQARAAGKSVYVFVGSDLSELSRTTEKEVFGRPETVAWLNENFFCIKVDADQEPEVAAYAQHFINTARQLKGWPVHLWLTPELQPYDGANYLPPTEEWGRPGFLKSARAALDAWAPDPARARALAEEAIAQMSAPPPAASGPIDLEARLAKATEAWLDAADRKNGGFGTAPKQPEPELIRFLLKRGPQAQAVAIAAARAIVNGGLHDRKEGGFYRRTIDAEWKEPYRQKLLSDQARIALALYDAADAAKDEKLRAAADLALRWVCERQQSKEGTFPAAMDVTGEKFEILGQASPAVEGILLAALCRSQDSRLMAERKKLNQEMTGRVKSYGPDGLYHSLKPYSRAAAADLMGIALGQKSAGMDNYPALLLAEATQAFLASNGQFMASPATLPPGIAVRVPALAEPFSVEALALLAGARGDDAKKLRQTLLAQIEYDELPAGAVLLGLAAGN